MSPFLVCSPLLIISGLAPEELGLDILKRWVEEEEEEAGGGGGGGSSALKHHCAGQENLKKRKKSLGYQALAGLTAAHIVRPCLIFLLFPPSFSSCFFCCFFFSFLLPHSWRDRLKFDRGGYTFPQMCANNKAFFDDLQNHLISLNTGPSGQISQPEPTPFPWNVIHTVCVVEAFVSD